MEKKSRVCVTGASGFIGSSLVRRLLEKGYVVHATLRNIGDESNYKVGLLKGLPGADTRLFLFEADIYDPDLFGPAIEGCEFIFLVATPLKHDPLNSKYKDTTEASLNGIHTILKFCEQSGTVRRVVYTGSVVATSPWKEDFTGYKDFIAESNWTTIDLPYPHYTDHLKDYTASKTLSEKEILKYNKEGEGGEGGLEVVSLNCALVGGDTILPYTPDSVLLIVSPLTGIELYHTSLKFLQGLLCSVPLVHIDDVCEAHIFCIERPVMAGRFLCAVDCPTMKDFVVYFAEEFPDLKLIKEVEGEGKRVKGCSQKLVDLGFKYKFSVEETLNASVECAKRLGGL
ncbi:NADPH HC-toxin reductase 1-like [Carex rostrata]